jgi:hypothetical protein
MTGIFEACDGFGKCASEQTLARHRLRCTVLRSAGLLPQALLFFPSVDFVSETVFHILPFALQRLALTPTNTMGSHDIQEEE